MTDSAPVTDTVTANRVAAEVKLELGEVTELREGKGTEGLCRRVRGGSGTSLQQIGLANEIQPLRWSTRGDAREKCDQVQV